MKKLSLAFICSLFLLVSCNKEEDVNLGTSTQVKNKIHFSGVKRPENMIETKGVARGNNLWNPDYPITIKFINGSSNNAETVKKYAKEWLKYAGVEFKYTEGKADVRIAFDWDEDNRFVTWSYTGTDAKFVRKQTEPTVNFVDFEDYSPEEQKGEVLRVFGQILGLELEHRHLKFDPQWQTEMRVQSYWELNIGDIEWDEIKEYVFAPFDDPDLIVQTEEFDPLSIMKWVFPKNITKNNEIKDNMTDFNTTLSETDKEFIGKLYPVSQLAIYPTNQTDGGFKNGAIGQNGKLYFTGNKDNGIWYLDNDGIIKQTNKTDGSFNCTNMGQNNKLYFAGYDGIWYLDNDGIVKPTNKIDGYFWETGIGQNGVLYFLSYYTGAWYLAEDGTIKQTNKTDGRLRGACMSSDNKLYIYDAGQGIFYLDDDGLIKSTNKIYTHFWCSSLGQNGVLYFGGYGGIWFLDTDKQIRNVRDGSFATTGTGQDGKLYFGSNVEAANGIYYLDDDGTIKQTNKTDGTFYCTGMGQNDKLYFGSYATEGIWFLDNDGIIKPSNKLDGVIQCTAMGQDGKLYFGSTNGIFVLEKEHVTND